MRNLLFGLCVITAITEAQAQDALCALLSDEQEVVIRPIGREWDASAIQVASRGGYLRPLFPGNLTASPAPFDFLVENDSFSVARGNIGGIGSVLIEFDGFRTGVHYKAPADVQFRDDFIGSWNQGGAAALSIAVCAVPEPPAIMIPSVLVAFVLHPRWRRLGV